MKKKIIPIAVIAVALIAVALLSDELIINASENSFFAMNTVCSSKISGKESDSVSEEIQAAVEKLDTDVLSRKNENPVAYAVSLCYNLTC